MSARLHWCFALLALALLPWGMPAQVLKGELAVAVRDPAGLPVPARVELLSWVSRFRAEQVADGTGRVRFKRIPVGVHRLRVSHPGFQPVVQRLEIPSEVPVAREIRLELAQVETELVVLELAPLLDPQQTGIVLQVGRQQLDEVGFTTSGRSVIDLVDRMPGWLLEANAVLHPRGSEYDTQYVIDGMPLYDNRSIGFMPGFGSEEFEAVNVLTGTIPAEFGRRLGGVIELDTRRSGRPGHHSEVRLLGGSFETYDGSFFHQYLGRRGSFSLGLQGGRTDRYLDPPSLENFTNAGNSAGFHGRAERDLSDRDRLSVYWRSNRVNFQVPNDRPQQAAGQRQDRRGAETAGQVHYQRVISSNTFATVRGLLRETSANLWSNPLSTPVFTQQDRGFTEGAVSGSVTIEAEKHSLKFGGDWRRADIREAFLFAESEELPEIDFAFDDNRRSTDVGLFIQDRWRLGRLVVDAGLRVDHYDLLIDDTAVSPRVGLGYYLREADLMLRASYDRAFQTPPIENLLLSNSAAVQDIENVEGALLVPAGRADFYEVGFRKPLGDRLRLDVSHYWREFENFYDDDVFLNTGVSFPITFDSARVEGTEVRLEMPWYKNFSSFLSYSNMLGTATSPVTGGLFIEGGEAAELRDNATAFPISQDQRNTLNFALRYEPHQRVWFSAAVRYGSGLPVELEDDEGDEGEESGAGGFGGADEGSLAGSSTVLVTIPREIVERVDFERGRVRPNFGLDFSLGVRLWEQGGRSVRLQFDVVNATDRLNVINFTGLFSGTALAPLRMFGVSLRAGL